MNLPRCAVCVASLLDVACTPFEGVLVCTSLEVCSFAVEVCDVGVCCSLSTPHDRKLFPDDLAVWSCAAIALRRQSR
jgi:hypothetical protein